MQFVRVVSLMVASLSAPAAADDGTRVAAYAAAGAELGIAGAIAIHTYTSSSPGSGVGLAVNFMPIVVGIGTGILGERLDLDPRPPLGFHGAIAGALPLMALGATIDGREAKCGASFGAAAAALGALGAVGGAYLGLTRIETLAESAAFISAPAVGALGGGVTFAIVHFFDDEGPSSTGRLLRYAGVGMLLGVAGSLIYAWPDRADTTTSSMRTMPVLSAGDGATVLSLGGRF
jgi:hypothetical protein